MLPLLPCSPYIRSKEFVAEEWKALFAENATEPADQVQGGWRGILYANFAISDPEASWKYFAQPNFDDSYIDDGATRTWYLAFAAGELIRRYGGRNNLLVADIVLQGWVVLHLKEKGGRV